MAPTEHESQLAEKSSRTLSYYVQDKMEQTIRVIPEGGKREEVVTLPAVAFRLLVNILTQMAQGNAVTLIPIHADVSRPFLVKLLGDGEIPYRKVGARRRVLYKDIAEYERRTDERRRATLNELAAQAQELGLGCE